MSDHRAKLMQAVAEREQQIVVIRAEIKRLKARINAEARRDYHREYMRKWRAEKGGSAIEYMRKWRAENAEHLREYRKGYYKDHRRAVIESVLRWKAANPDRVKEYKRRYRERMKSLQTQFPAFGELSKSALLQNDVYAAANAAVPSYLPAWLRDDVISEVVLNVYEGNADPSNIEEAAKLALRKHRSTMFRELSLNQPQYEGGPDWIESLTAEDQAW